MRLAGNLSLLFGHLTVGDRFEAASASGFRHVEILAPYDHPPEWYAHKLRAHGLSLELINTPMQSPHEAFGVAARPGAQVLFRQGVHRAAEVCAATGCRAVHVMAGKRDAQYQIEEQIDVFYSNLQWASDEYPELVLHLEALNNVDVPGYFYSRPCQVLKALEQLKAANIGMQFDFYHVVKQGLNLVDELRHCFLVIRHIQVGGAPSRHEPDLAKDGLFAGFELLHQQGYEGMVGLEYRPLHGVKDGLDWLRPLHDRTWVSF